MSTLSLADLAQFSGGTGQWYRHGLVRSVLYTDGARHVAEHGGAYWLLDMIATNQLLPEVAREEFQVWTLTVHADKSATLSCTNGNSREVYAEPIEWTDFPLLSITLWAETDDRTHRVILLPCEH